MKKNTDTFKGHVLATFHRLKDTTFRIHTIPGLHNKTAFQLAPLNKASLDDASIINLLSNWRDKAQEWFPSQFTITDIGTRKWLKKAVIENADRILFMIQVKNEYIGHVGLYRFDFDKQTADIDNIIRGENKYPGIMESALVHMMEWGRDELGIYGYTLSTHADNKPAVKLYEKLGFVEMKKVPIVKKKFDDHTEWQEVKDAPKSHKKYNLYMKLRSQKKIAFAGPSITQKEINYAHEAATQGFYDNYDMHVKRLEKTVAEYLGVKYVIGTHCCTLALHLACATLGFQKGDEVICTDFSWVATANAIAYTGATPVFADIDPDTWCIDPQKIEEAITPRTKGIMLVHTFGHPADMDAIMKIAKKHKLKVVEDAAPALGATYKGKKAATFGDIACISFQGAKIAATGEGGVFITNNKELYEKAALLSQMGRTDSESPFWCDFLGYQYGIGNISASLACAQVERIDELLKIKRTIFNQYYRRLKNIKGIKVIREVEGCKSNYSYPSILLENATTEKRDHILATFKKLNIHARPGFPPMSEFPHFKKEFRSKKRYKNPVTHTVWKQGISLPSAANTNERDVNFVCDTLLQLLES